MCNDIDWSKGEESFEECFSNSLNVRENAHRFPKGHWSFLGPGTEEKRHGTHTYKTEGKWNHCADVMMRKRTSSFLSNKFEQIKFWKKIKKRKTTKHQNYFKNQGKEQKKKRPPTTRDCSTTFFDKKCYKKSCSNWGQKKKQGKKETAIEVRKKDAGLWRSKSALQASYFF